MSKVKIVEVGPRDGLQNEVSNLDISTRYKFIKKLMDCGYSHIEIGAFVSPRWVPQMEGSGKLIKKVLKYKSSKKQYSKIQFSALTPNIKGLEHALETDIKEIAVFGACSETFSQKNINCSISQSFKNFEKVIQLAHKNKIKVRGYLSTVFGCPFEGKVSVAKVNRIVDQMFSLGVYEVSLGDTIGVATPGQVQKVLSHQKVNKNLKNIALHMHNTRGTALANVLKGLDMGVKTFDSSLGGLGGCPYAKGATGNLATEELVYMLNGMGIKTGIDLNQLVKISDWMENQVGRTLPSQVTKERIKQKYF